MLFIVVAIVLIGVVIASKMQLRSGMRAGDLGSMSEQWLNEYRAAHPE
jgi:hypothetical protein